MMINSTYNVGGSLSPDSKNYVERDGDIELLNFCQQINPKNNIHFLLAPRQRGKSSLKNRTIFKLKSEKIIGVAINLQATVYTEKFWRTFTVKICEGIVNAQELKSELNTFWKENSENYLPPDRFIQFLLQKILPSLEAKKLVIFVDEVQALIKYNFQDEFVQCLRNIYEDKINIKDEILEKISFVLIGVAKLNEFTQHVALNIATKTELDYFHLEKCQPLIEGLKQVTENPAQIFERVFYWTNGQPFLTQLICDLLVKEYYSQKLINNGLKITIENIDRLVEKDIIKRWINQGKEEKEHFQEVQKLFLTRDESQIEDKLQVLNYYEQKIFDRQSVKWKSGYNIHDDLLMSGLVIKVIENDKYYLKIANPIYEKVFNYTWLDEIRYKLATVNITSEENESSLEDLDNQSLIKKSLKILQESFEPFFEARMDKYLDEDWQNNPQVRTIIRPPDDESPLTTYDTKKLLILIVKYWENVFTNVFNYRDKCEIEALLSICHQEEKQKADFDRDLTIKIMNTIAYLLNIKGDKSQAENINELMMNKYPKQMDLILVNNRNNTLGYEKYNQQEKNMVTNTPTFNQQLSNMDRANSIANILNKRHPRSQKVQKLIDKLNSLLSQLDSMETTCRDTIAKINDTFVTENLSTLFPLFSEIKTQKIKQVQQILAKLNKRFSRENLTIALVGRAGQGKSLLIQTLTGLSDPEVPSGAMNNCTGVKVTVAHSTNHQAVGEVYFHNEESFLQENIHLYYDFLHLGTKPKTLNDFVDNPLPKLPINTSEAKALYEHLEKCYNHYQDYSDLLREASPKRISQVQIRKYVAQTDDNNQKTYFNYLAVKEVKIFCQFPYQDIGQIALIDLPGLGDTVLGDKETLRKSLGEDVDFALFISLPQGTRILQEEEYKLFDTADAALPELPIKNWSMMVLNEIKVSQPGLAANRSYCEEIKRRLEAKKEIEVSRCLIANCADKKEASDVLNQVLDYLESNIEDLDGQYAAIANKSIEQLEREIKDFLQKARQAFRVAPQYQNENILFDELEEKLTIKINRNLDQLIKEIRPETLTIEENRKDTELFQTATRKIIKECLEDTGVHSIERIDEMRYGDIGQGWVSVLQKCVNELRNHISKKFNSFDSGLEVYVEQMKNQIADALTKTDLGNITTARGTEFLEFMVKEIPEHLPVLKEAFEKLVSFEMTYEFHLEHLILQALEKELDPNEVAKIFDPVGKSNQENIELIHKILKVVHRNTISKCRQALEKLEGMPSIIVYARANRFVDAIIYSKKIKSNWRVLLREWSSQVFPDHFGKGISEEKQQWFDFIQKASSLSTLERI